MKCVAMVTLGVYLQGCRADPELFQSQSHRLGAVFWSRLESVLDLGAGSGSGHSVVPGGENPAVGRFCSGTGSGPLTLIHSPVTSDWVCCSQRESLQADVIRHFQEEDSEDGPTGNKQTQVKTKGSGSGPSESSDFLDKFCRTSEFGSR